MYQFIVATRSTGTFVGPEDSSLSGGDVPDEAISTMSIARNNGANKWASRAVVALQLAAWSAVGIVLLEKGVGALQKSSQTPLNVSQEITTSVSPSDSLYNQVLDIPTRTGRLLSPNEIDSLSVVPIEGDGRNSANNELEENERTKSSETEKRRSTAEAASVEKREEMTRSQGVNKSASSPRQQLEQSDAKGTNDVANKNGQVPQLDSLEERENSEIKDTNGNKGENRDQQERNEIMKETANNEELPQDKTWSSPVTVTVIMDSFEERRWESRKRLRGARVNSGGGAAAAVAMVAVGAIMLVLGPAVIILRALDERRQERRFLKLSREEDLPPSYEEATSDLDQAPTYSSLNLDSILIAPTSANSNDSEHACPNANCRRESCCC